MRDGRRRRPAEKATPLGGHRLSTPAEGPLGGRNPSSLRPCFWRSVAYSTKSLGRLPRTPTTTSGRILAVLFACLRPLWLRAAAEISPTRPWSAYSAPVVLSPAMIVLVSASGSASPVYYYRKAYYRSLLLSPPAAPSRAQLHRRKSPLILQNAVVLYLGLLFNGMRLAIEAFHSATSRLHGLRHLNLRPERHPSYGPTRSPVIPAAT